MLRSWDTGQYPSIAWPDQSQHEEGEQEIITECVEKRGQWASYFSIIINVHMWSNIFGLPKSSKYSSRNRFRRFNEVCCDLEESLHRGVSHCCAVLSVFHSESPAYVCSLLEVFLWSLLLDFSWGWWENTAYGRGQCSPVVRLYEDTSHDMFPTLSCFCPKFPIVSLFVKGERQGRALGWWVYHRSKVWALAWLDRDGYPINWLHERSVSWLIIHGSDYRSLANRLQERWRTTYNSKIVDLSKDQRQKIYSQTILFAHGPWHTADGQWLQASLWLCWVDTTLDPRPTSKFGHSHSIKDTEGI